MEKAIDVYAEHKNRLASMKAGTMTLVDSAALATLVLADRVEALRQTIERSATEKTVVGEG